MRRLRAGMSAVLLAAIVTSPGSGALTAFAPHDRCAALQHACGRVTHFLACCCRDSGSASERQSGLLRSPHRVLSSHDASTLAWRGSTAAVMPATRSPFALYSARGRPPDLPILLATLRI